MASNGLEWACNGVEWALNDAAVAAAANVADGCARPVTSGRSLGYRRAPVIESCPELLVRFCRRWPDLTFFRRGCITVAPGFIG